MEHSRRLNLGTLVMYKSTSIKFDRLSASEMRLEEDTNTVCVVVGTWAWVTVANELVRKVFLNEKPGVAAYDGAKREGYVLLPTGRSSFLYSLWGDTMLGRLKELKN